MSIPLDRLYHYIESVAKDVYGDVLIYRFYPHGSKNVKDLSPLQDRALLNWVTLKEIYCYDQEPLNHQLYLNQKPDVIEYLIENGASPEDIDTVPTLMRNFRYHTGNIHDLCLLLHSECNSPEVNVYRQMNFIPVYYWSHAIISLDWFRYAQFAKFTKVENTKNFLIYNRAWQGSREYRMKFADLLIDNNLVDSCQTSFRFTDDGVDYKDHAFINTQWKPTNQLEQYFQKNSTTSCYSADFDIDDYNSTDFEVVLETLFQDPRNHLTEKTLRPIACRQPFILASTAGSLAYLRSYGFKTFDGIIDESYDVITDHYERLLAIIEVMKTIKNWTLAERQLKLQQIESIVDYNQKYFFSGEFFNLITQELKTNLQKGLETLERENTSQIYLNLRKKLAKIPLIYDLLFRESSDNFTRQDHVKMLTEARKYYNRYRANRK